MLREDSFSHAGGIGHRPEQGYGQKGVASGHGGVGLGPRQDPSAPLGHLAAGRPGR